MFEWIKDDHSAVSNYINYNRKIVVVKLNDSNQSMIARYGIPNYNDFERIFSR